MKSDAGPSVKPRLIGDGFDSFMAAAYPQGCPPYQREDLRRAFFGGAAVLLASLEASLSPGDEPTEEDMRRAAAVFEELQIFGAEMTRHVTGGREH